MQNDDVAHEHSDINITALVWSMVVMFGVVLGTAGLMALLFGFLEREAKARDPKLSPLAMPATTMPKTTIASPFFGGAPDPKLMTGEPMNLRDMRTEEQTQLHGYGWMNEKAGVAHIPIDEAKKLTLERGLPVRPEPLTDAATRNACARVGRVVLWPEHHAGARRQRQPNPRRHRPPRQGTRRTNSSRFKVQGSGFRVQGSVTGMTRGLLITALGHWRSLPARRRTPRIRAGWSSPGIRRRHGQASSARSRSISASAPRCRPTFRSSTRTASR